MNHKSGIRATWTAFATGLLSLAMLPASGIAEELPSEKIAAWLETVEYEMPPDHLIETYSDFYNLSRFQEMPYEQAPSPRQAIAADLLMNRAVIDYFTSEQDRTIPRDAEVVALASYHTWLVNTWLQEQITLPPLSDEDIAAHYEATKERFLSPEMASFRHIYFFVPPDAEEDEWKAREEEPQRVAELLRRGRTFEQLAPRYPDAEGNPQRGEVVGPVHLERLQPGIRDLFRSADEGDILGPVRTRFGLEVIQLVEYSPEHDQTLEEVTPLIASELHTPYVQEQQQELMAELEENYPSRQYEDEDGNWMLDVGEMTFTWDEIFEMVDMTREFVGLSDEERVEAFLPRFIVTYQIVQDAKATNIPPREVAEAQLEAFRHRLGAEAFVRSPPAMPDPTEEELRRFFEQNSYNFNTLEQVKARVYRVEIPDWDELDRPGQNYQREALMHKLREASDLYNSGDEANQAAAIEQLEELGASVRESDEWIRPGPSGYLMDQALFGTTNGNMSSPIQSNRGATVVIITDYMPPQPREFADVKEEVEQRYATAFAREEREAIQELFREHFFEFAADR